MNWKASATLWTRSSPRMTVVIFHLLSRRDDGSGRRVHHLPPPFSTMRGARLPWRREPLVVAAARSSTGGRAAPTPAVPALPSRRRLADPRSTALRSLLLVGSGGYRDSRSPGRRGESLGGGGGGRPPAALFPRHRRVGLGHARRCPPGRRPADPEPDPAAARGRARDQAVPTHRARRPPHRSGPRPPGA